ncbi:hypothetical protein KZX29_11515 [Moraxella osloensis]|uniref:hypothetical protein n=1 Tax=Faucicola osloensis TaxID=34062 RepID=UPI002004A3F1|nr:hypothetical protein [Moraxella osloensis]MCK6159405.1 hypothetical protein [Moraxella osloensis]
MEIKQGESRTLTGDFTTSDGTPIDLAQYTVKCYIGNTYNQKMLEPPVVLTGGNQFLIELTTADTSKLKPAIYRFELWRFVGDKAVASQSASITIKPRIK